MLKIYLAFIIQGKTSKTTEYIIHENFENSDYMDSSQILILREEYKVKLCMLDKF